MERPATDESEREGSPLRYTCSRPRRLLHHENHVGLLLLAISATNTQPASEPLPLHTPLPDSTGSASLGALPLTTRWGRSASPPWPTIERRFPRSEALLRPRLSRRSAERAAETKQGHTARFPCCNEEIATPIHVKGCIMLHLATLRMVISVLARARLYFPSIG